MQNIHEWGQKIKFSLEGSVAEWALFAIVFLVALASFGLGRLSALENAKPLVSVSQAPTDDKPRAMALGGYFVGSRTGSVYYYPWCAGAAKIPPESQVWFRNEAEAQKAGYNPAKNCKGLEK